MTAVPSCTSPAKAGAQSWNGSWVKAVHAFVGHRDWAPAFAVEALGVGEGAQ
jgi:hypothetical protein